MFTKYLQALRAAGASMRAGGIAIRKGYSLGLPNLNVPEKKDPTPVLRGFERDALNLAADWQLVGDDIQRAIQKIGGEIERK